MSFSYRDSDLVSCCIVNLCFYEVLNIWSNEAGEGLLQGGLGVCRGFHLPVKLNSGDFKDRDYKSKEELSVPVWKKIIENLQENT